MADKLQYLEKNEVKYSIQFGELFDNTDHDDYEEFEFEDHSEAVNLHHQFLTVAVSKLHEYRDRMEEQIIAHDGQIVIGP